MTYTIIIFLFISLALVVLIWLRKIQFDAVHRNFLDLVDHFGGKVQRGGFAIRPRFSGEYQGFPVSISISSERKKKDQSRQFYISIYFKSPANFNFTVLSRDWLKGRNEAETNKRNFAEIVEKKYRLEGSNINIRKNLEITTIEDIIKNIHPIAYVLVSKKGMILERISTNLIKDTEFGALNKLLEGLWKLSQLSAKEE
jgi:hypothetical protein